MDYKQLFLNFVNNLTEKQIEKISKSREDIYWSKERQEFYLWPHQVQNYYYDFKVFDSTADEDFDAKSSMIDFGDQVDDVFGGLEHFEELRMKQPRNLELAEKYKANR